MSFMNFARDIDKPISGLERPVNYMKANNDETQQENSRYEIKSDQELNWAFRMAEQKRKEVQDIIVMMEQSDDFYMNKIDDLRKDIEYFNSLIAEYASKQTQANPEWEYKGSPFGRIVRSKASTKFVVSDKEALMDQLKDTDYVETKEVKKLKWGDLKKALVSPDNEHVMTQDGEPVNNVKVVVTPSKLEIKHKNDRGNWVTKEG